MPSPTWSAADSCRRCSVRFGLLGEVAAIAAPELDLNPVLDANIIFYGVTIEDDGQRTRELASLLAGAPCARS